ncbi:MAG: 16S rRNA (cytosine(1402)-N(4))-methyltransferase RsmH [Burkholderiales bacterium]|nr:16S rRNA (cytosine(1402)-N(4))-methyltransferase RsmH [Burkholderiales bacterium]
MTASLQHVPVLLEQAIGALGVRAAGIYVDCTFGRGGHSRAILARLGMEGRLIGLDRDPAAVSAGREILDDRFDIAHAAFSELREVLDRFAIDAVDGVLLDLGVSSAQLDDPQRGFSFRQPGPLDMRMDTSGGQSAAEWLASAAESEIREVIARYGEERFAKQIATAIVAARAQRPVASTRELAAIVAKAVRTREAHQDPATRTFQAVRIHVNQELAQLALVLPQALAALRPGGRLVVVSFHSLEDRIVKQFMREQSAGDRLPPDLPVRARDLPRARARIVGKPVRPCADEIAANPRARSAIMRVVERV